jgi:hypothetical protein
MEVTEVAAYAAAVLTPAAVVVVGQSPCRRGTLPSAACQVLCDGGSSSPTWGSPQRIRGCGGDLEGGRGVGTRFLGPTKGRNAAPAGWEPAPC